MSKVCTKCLIDKDLSLFPKSSSFLSGYNSICKQCINAINKKWRDNNKHSFCLMRQKHYQEHKDKHRAEKRAYGRLHKKEKATYDVQYRKLKKDKIKQYKKEWESLRRNDPVFKIKRNLRRRIHHVLKDGYKSAKTFDLIGCTAEEFKLYIESLFTDGMSWDNYGPSGWHIDHIIPCYKFDLSLESEQRTCFHYTNQRPLWAKDNLSRQRI
jgi:hypothetical protein